MSTTPLDRWVRARRKVVSVLWGAADWAVMVVLVIPAIALLFLCETLEIACWRLSGWVERKRYRLGAGEGREGEKTA